MDLNLAQRISLHMVQRISRLYDLGIYAILEFKRLQGGERVYEIITSKVEMTVSSVSNNLYLLWGILWCTWVDSHISDLRKEPLVSIV